MNKLLLASLLCVVLSGCQLTPESSTDSTPSQTNFSDLTHTALLTTTQSWGQQSTAQTIAKAVSQQTDISATQASGGVASLLALAQNSLNSQQNEELTRLIPGMSTLQQTGVTSLIRNKSNVNSAFNSLGLSPELVSSFTPVILNMLKTQGASSPLLEALSSVWQF
jgi:hypothetical protein